MVVRVPFFFFFFFFFFNFFGGGGLNCGVRQHCPQFFKFVREGSVESADQTDYAPI